MLRAFLILAVVFISLGLFFALFYSPPDYLQSEAVRIMYVHVPSAWLSLLSYSSIFLLSIFYLIWKFPLFLIIAREGLLMGFSFTLIAMVTGALWGKPTWGTYWVWDARLTTTLLLFLIFMGYFLLRMSVNDRDKEARLASVIGIIGFLDIPIIHKSVEWWRTLHQPSTLFNVDSGEVKPSMPQELLFPLLASTLVMLLFYFYLLLLRYQTEKHTDKLNQLLAETEG